MTAREAHVWRFLLNGHADDRVLSPEERARAARFGRRRRREFVIGRTVLRRVLGAYVGGDPATLPIVEGPSGKPALAAGSGHEWLRFSVSHADDLLLIALAREREVGVDVERVAPERARASIADELFSATEAAVLRSLPPSRRTPAFFAMWTRKEAYLKGTGIGMAVRLEEVDVFSPAPGWSLCGLDIGPPYAAALAVEGEDLAIRLLPGQSLERARDRGRIPSRNEHGLLARRPGRHDRESERHALAGESR